MAGRNEYFYVNSVFFSCRTKRPIRCVLERNEDMLMTAGRHPFKGVYKVCYRKLNTIYVHYGNMLVGD